MATVHLERVSKTYAGGVAAVRDVTLSVGDGEFVVMVGPSGCGKSTTLRMIAGLETVGEGTVAIAGRVVNDVPPKDRDVAMVFQNYALYPHMTSYENMAFGLRLRKRPRAEIDVRVREAADILGISGLLDRRPRELSGGQRQRVAVGRAIVRKPSVFLFDEPLSNLDAKMRVQMRAELKRLHGRLRATMIYVTHDQVEAMTLGDRIVVMKDGEIRQAATPGDLYARPADVFVAGFIGSPPMNLLRGAVEATAEGPRFRSGPLEWPVSAGAAAAAGRPLLFGVRPEELSVEGDGAPAGRSIGRARLDWAEPTGADTYWHLEAGGQSLVVRVDPGLRTPAGGDVTVRIREGRGRCFDPDTGRALE